MEIALFFAEGERNHTLPANFSNIEDEKDKLKSSQQINI